MRQMPQVINDAAEQLCSEIEGPFFLYDLDGFERHVRALAKSNVKLWYAVKANPLSAIIRILAENGFGFDVASVGELEQVLAQGVSPERILNTGPAKSRQQLSVFLAKGVMTYVVESIGQLELLQQLAVEMDIKPSVLLRVQLRWERDDDRHNPLGGGDVTPFGLSPEDWLQCDVRRFDQVTIKGLHTFQWGNVQSAQRLEALWLALLEPLNELADKMGLDYRVLDLGGGLGIAYDSDNTVLQWPDVRQRLEQISQSSGKSVWMELGRYAIGGYGYYICPVVERKQNCGQQQLIMAGGVNHLMRPAITNQSFPATLARSSEAEKQPFHVYGPLCTGLDKLGSFFLPSDIGSDDALIFSQCGAYGFTESMPLFLCHALPAEAIIYHSQIKILREPQAASDWLR